jgi:hypothetical protein
MLPTRLSEISLQQYVTWNELYYGYLKKQSEAINGDADKKLLFETGYYERHYAMYSGMPLEEVQNKVSTDVDFYMQVLQESAKSIACLFDEMYIIDNMPFDNSPFDFNGDLIVLRPPVIIEDSTGITKEQYETIRDVALVFSDLQDSKHDAWYELCALYLHPVEDIEIESDYWKERMKQLPLNIAMTVRSYVKSTIDLYVNLMHDRTTTAS